MSLFNKRSLAAIVAGIGVLGAVAFVVGGSRHASAMKSDVHAASVVKVEAALGRSIRDWQEYAGRLEAVEHVEIRPRVAGAIVAVHFQDGQLVRKGALLYTIDPAPFEVQLQQAQAALSMAADRKRFANSELSRAQRLIEDRAISRREFDSLENMAREAASGMKSAQAAVSRARLDLGYTRIAAPIDGRISRPELTVGNVVSAGGDAAPLTSIVAVESVYASFNVDEQTYLRFIGPDARSGKQPQTVRLGLANENGHPHAGAIHSVDNQLDPRSGTIRVRARFSTSDSSMIPGLQARVRVEASASHPAVLIPESAIGTDQDRKFVFVVDGANKVVYRVLALGSRQGGLRVVNSGVRAGERVIVDGAQRVKPGEVVTAQLAANAATTQ